MQMKMQIEKHLKFKTQAENLISDVISEQTSLQLYCQSFANDKFRKQLRVCLAIVTLYGFVTRSLIVYFPTLITTFVFTSIDKFLKSYWAEVFDNIGGLFNCYF